MKKLNLKNLMNGMIFGALVVMLMIASVGCDKKKSNNNNFNNCRNGYCQNGGIGNGFQPGFGSGVVGVGYDNMSGSEVFIEIVGSDQFGGNYYPTGQVYVYGQINTQGMQCGYGGFVPADSYQLESQYPSYSQNGVVSNAQLIGYGYTGNQIVVQVSYATMQYPTGGFQNSQYLPLSASLTISSVNGQPCNKFMGIQPW